MNELAQMTFNQFVLAHDAVPWQLRIAATDRNEFVEIMEMLDKRLNDKGKNWRHVFKVRFPHSPPTLLLL